MGIDAEDGGPGGHGPISVYGDVVDNIYNSATNGGTGILVIGAGHSPSDGPTTFWTAIAADTGKPVTFVNGAAAISAVSFAPFRMIAVVSDEFNTFGGLTNAENNALTGRQNDVAAFVNAGGGLLGFTSDFDFVGGTPYGYLSAVGTFTVTTGQGYDNITPTIQGSAIGITDALDVCCWHDYYDGFPNFLDVLANDAFNGRVAAIGGVQVVVPTTIALDPLTATNPPGTQHTVTATVKDTNGNPQQGVLVSFEVTSGPNAGLQSPPGCSADPGCTTDANGQVSWTYQSNGQTGTDTIRACFTDQQQQQHCATATKEWESTVGPPATLTLSPPTATNRAGEQHCVTATVKDASGNPVPGITVQFSVSGANSASGSAVTDANGEATFCYTGQNAGNDTINAFADVDGDGSDDGASEPDGTAQKTYVAADPATLTLSPKTATNEVDSQHCVTAHVEDAFGNPTPGITVEFSTSGSTSASGQATTNSTGDAQFCYTGPALPGADAISAFADTNNNGTDDGASEPDDTASKTWTLPGGTPCVVKITNGGWIVTDDGDRGSFGGNAKQTTTSVMGNENYQDHGPAEPMHVKSINVLVVTCSADRKEGSIFGQATIDGTGVHNYRIDVRDLGEPGRGTDTYRIRLDTGYDSGDHILRGGNVQIH